MGANIGTTATAALVTLGQLRDLGELERGFATASVHVMFNVLTVAILFPLECATGYLAKVSAVIVTGSEARSGENSYIGPVRRIVEPLVDAVIISNKHIISSVAKGKSCLDFYPIECDPAFAPSYATCTTGLIGCNEKTGLYVRAMRCCCCC